MAHCVAGAADRGVLQDPPLRLRRADVPRARRARPARAGHAGDAAQGGRTRRCGNRSARSTRTGSSSPRCRRSSRNPVLLGSLLLAARTDAARLSRDEHDDALDDADADVATDARRDAMDGPTGTRRRPRGRTWSTDRRRSPPKEPMLKIGMPADCAAATPSGCGRCCRCSRGLRDLESTPRAKRALMHRGPFEDALTWLEIHGHAPAMVEHWKGFIEALVATGAHRPGRRRRRAAAPAAR